MKAAFSQRPKILIADDHKPNLIAIRRILTGIDADLVEATTGNEVLAATLDHEFALILLDVQMPAGGAATGDGIDALPLLTRAAPDARVIVVTTFGRPGYLRRAIEAGAIGFMVKDAPAERLVEGIRAAASGLRVVDPELAFASLSIGPSPLTEKEAQVLAAASGGASTAEIAHAAFLSEGTVRNDLSSAIGKLGARNRAEALRTATDNGWL